jgi:hypothetical protein
LANILSYGVAYKYDHMVWTGFTLLRVGFSDGLLWAL